MDHRPYQKNFVGSELSAPLDGLLGQDFDRVGSSLQNTYSSIAAPSAQYPPTSMPVLSNQQSHLGFSSAEPASYVDDGKFLLPYQDCNAMVLLNSLIFLEQKIRDLQDVVKSMIQYGPDDGFLIRKQIVMADTASIISQVVSTTMRLFPVDQQQSFRGNLDSNFNPVIAYLGSIVGAASELGLGNLQQIESETPIVATGIANGCLDFSPPLKPDNQVKRSVFPIQGSEPGPADLGFTGDKKDGEDDWEEENLSPCSYEVLELKKEEILAPHAHFCSICGKGFKRDANLRMHMRGHGDEYKTPQALAKPNEEASLCPVRLRRYSCPFEGCKRNRKHKKFLALKTILSVKNHYRRSHCDKSYVCSKCNSKKFSVIADLRTHEKHCGRDNWLCSCGTTFSRKDKLFGHVALFQGHRPLILANEVKGYVATDEPVKAERTKIGNASSSNLASEAGSERVVFARREDKKQNLQADCFGTMGMATQSPLTHMGASVSLHASPSGNFIESNGGNPNCGGL